MGFTPLDGLMMGRRPGRLDPGAVLWLVEQHGGDAAVSRLLNQEAGLLGVSGLSPDMRILLESRSEGAELALAMFVDRLVQEIGSAAAAIGGLDALVFTGGIGENAATVRQRALEALTWLGLAVDPAANARHHLDITMPDSRISAHVVPCDEELMIAEAALA
jgi:acetate kinase